jgi:hypothetical protein
MGFELFANNAQTTLNGGINNSTTSITVTSGSVFPSTGNFRILIDSEIMLVTSRSSNILTVVRAKESTTAASHNDLSTVTMVITDEGLRTFRSDVNVSDTFANRATAGLAGRVFYPTDDYSFYRDNGSSWLSFFPNMRITPPDDSLFSWVNQGGGGTNTVTQQGSALYMTIPGSNGAVSLHMRVKALPSAPYTITIGFIPTLPCSDHNQGGICLYDSGTGKIIGMYIYTDQESNTNPSMYMKLGKWTNTTTFSADYNWGHSNPVLGADTWMTGPCMWFRIHDDGSNRTWHASADGTNFIQLASQTNTDFCTPDKVGYFLNPNGAATFMSGILILSWLEN